MDYPFHKLDTVHWNRLRNLEAKDVFMRSRCTLIEPHGYYGVDFLGETVWVDIKKERFLSPLGEVLNFRVEAALAIVVYLIEAKNLPLSGCWVSAKGLKGGEMFFRGPHSFPVTPLQSKLGANSDRFLKAGRKCGGDKGDFGDVSFQVMAFPRIPIQVILWLADEDFPARVTFLFDSTIEQHLPLDVIYGLVSELCIHLTKD